MFKFVLGFSCALSIVGQTAHMATTGDLAIPGPATPVNLDSINPALGPYFIPYATIPMSPAVD